LKVIQVGCYPPPWGGVSTHLKRLLDYLDGRGVESLLIDVSGIAKERRGVICRSWAEAKRLLLGSPRSVIHFHNFEAANAPFYARAALRHRTILSFHNQRFLDEIQAARAPRRGVTRFCLNRLDRVVVDSPVGRTLAGELIRDASKLRLIPEFIPPATVPPLSDPALLALRRRHPFLLASGAFRLVFHAGHDLYGLDLLVEMLSRLVTERGLDAGLAFLLPDVGDPAYLGRIRERISALALGERFHIVTTPLEESASLWRLADVVVRATNTDGNSMTVLEALSLGVPVVASDCAPRPEAAVLFRTRDLDDLVDTVADVLAQRERHRARLAEIRIEDNARAFLELYGELGVEVGLAA